MEFIFKKQVIKDIKILCNKKQRYNTFFAWKDFLRLRADKAAHPEAQQLAYPLKEVFKIKGIITD